MKAKIIPFCFVLLSQCGSPQDKHFSQSITSTAAESMAYHTWNWIGCWWVKFYTLKLYSQQNPNALAIYTLRAEVDNFSGVAFKLVPDNSTFKILNI